jgi:hypothetical protein
MRRGARPSPDAVIALRALRPGVSGARLIPHRKAAHMSILEIVLLVLLIAFLVGGVASSHLLLIVALVLLVILIAGRFPGRTV